MAFFIKNSREGWVDATNDIKLVKPNENGSYFIVFKNGKGYPISASCYMNRPTIEKVKVSQQYLQKYFNAERITLYKEDNLYYILKDGEKLEFVLTDTIRNFKKFIDRQNNIPKYFTALANKVDEETHSDFLSSQYGKIEKSWNEENVLSDFINKNLSVQDNFKLLLPFRHNKSQIIAIKNAIFNNISVIQGPPGTGKTQTILNIIANIVVNDKNVAIVSNNNDAVNNVFEKLDEEGYGCLCAQLGNLENRDEFFSKKHSIGEFKYDDVDDSIHSLVSDEIKYFELNSEIISLKENENKTKKEIEKINKSNLLVEDQSLNSCLEEYDSDSLMSLSLFFEKKGKERFNFFDKLFCCLSYKIPFKLMTGNIPEISGQIKYKSLSQKLIEIQDKLAQKQNEFERIGANSDFSKIIESSKNRLNKFLSEKYTTNKKEFEKDSYKKDFFSFVSRFPVILSSTFSLPTSVPKDFCFDYLIIDESSQSTIVSVLPALAKAKKVVIIGDDAQLPPVVQKNILDEEVEIFEKYPIDYNLRDYGTSFLGCVLKYLDKVPTTMLSEHYRCANQIISFSNRRVYNDKLEIQKPFDDKKHLMLIKTVPGNHARRNDSGGSGLYNQREIDEIVNFIKELPNNKSIGVITPYHRQAELLKESLPNNIEVGTIHTFQGRERDIIIFSSVINDGDDYEKDEEIIKNFVNNDRLINVAVTRAKDQFIFVTSDKIANSNNGILADLVKYIKYETLSEVKNGVISSVFDVLYSNYEDVRKKILEKDGDYLSEIVIENLLKEVLMNEKFISLSYLKHVNLKEIIKIDKDKYSSDEFKYLTHPWTHLDFVIFNKFDKIPILAIEVDGIRFHEQSEKQLNKDEIKNKALLNAKLPILRLKTNESNEKLRIFNALDEALKTDDD